ncbi:PHB depolymerase family esterase [Catellatospora sp. IY07-71]|uniref:alpha/beta hydrolase family esterase n=1 Tax=Catellatospora sp. IY07-71 TaxID=2728827 RepID=UPI001FD00905|nr:PHB depolymerase family esterase [Catellatospora sp. IY07-71]
MIANRLRRTPAVLALALLAAAGCDQANPHTGPAPAPSPSAAPEPVETPAPGDHRLSTRWNGKDRTFTVHAPPSYDGTKALPLVVVMHAFPGSGDAVAETSAMSAKADREGFLVLYPDGWSGGMNALICCGDEDDVGLIRTLVDRMVQRWKADPARVYATGISNGGDMSVRLAIELSDVFAAVAPVSGGIGGRALSDPAYRPAKPVSLVTFIGAQDRYHAQFTAGLAAWRERLACTPDGPHTIRPAKGLKIEQFKCGDGSRVLVYDIAAMGHSWPGAKQGGMAQPDAPVAATDAMWDFFKAHTRS